MVLYYQNKIRNTLHNFPASLLRNKEASYFIVLHYHCGMIKRTTTFPASLLWDNKNHLYYCHALSFWDKETFYIIALHHPTGIMQFHAGMPYIISLGCWNKLSLGYWNKLHNFPASSLWDIKTSYSIALYHHAGTIKHSDQLPCII